jgi:hypothetical protein
MKMTMITIIITTNGRIGMKTTTSLKTITGLLPDIRMRTRTTKTIMMNVTTRMMTIRTAGECTEEMKTMKIGKEVATIAEVKEIIIGRLQTVIPALPVTIPETVVSVAIAKDIL